MHDELVDTYEAALRRLPEPYSLVLRLRSAGVEDQIICDYLRIEPEGLETFVEIAEKKLERALRQQ